MPRSPANSIYKALAFIRCLPAAVLVGWLAVQGQSSAEAKSECLAAPMLAPDIPRAQFCGCYVGKVNSVWNRLHRAFSDRQERHSNLHGIVYEYSAAALRSEADSTERNGAPIRL